MAHASPVRSLPAKQWTTTPPVGASATASIAWAKFGASSSVISP